MLFVAWMMDRQEAKMQDNGVGVKIAQLSAGKPGLLGLDHACTANGNGAWDFGNVDRREELGVLPYVSIYISAKATLSKPVS